MENQATKTVKFWQPWEVELFAQGKTDKEIAALTGRNQGAISVKRSAVKRAQKKASSKPKRKYTTRKTSSANTETAKITANDLHFVVNGLDLYVNNGCKNVYIRKDKVEVNF